MNMPSPLSTPDAREVGRVEALVTVLNAEDAPAFLDRCKVGSTWTAHIRTAEVIATVSARSPLGTFDESICTCVRLKLSRPVPVEPRLRFRIVADDESGIEAAAVVRPWGG